MAEQQEHAETRRAEAGRRADAQTAQQQARLREGARDAAHESRRTGEQIAMLGVETLTVWMDIQQRVGRDWIELTSESVQESARMLSQLQQAGLDVLTDVQTTTWRWWGLWPEAFRDPLRCYERAVEEAIDGGRRGLRASRAGFAAMTRTMEQMEDRAGRTAATMQETFREAAGRMQDVTHRADRLRAA